MRISIISGVHIRRAQHLNQLFFEFPATQENPLFISFVFFSFKFPYWAKRLQNAPHHQMAVRTSVIQVWKAPTMWFWKENMKEEKPKEKNNQIVML